MKVNPIAIWKAWRREELLAQTQQERQEKFRQKKKAVMANAIFS